MVLDFGNSIFSQRDVRETETTTSLPSGTHYLMIAAAGFTSQNPASDAVTQTGTHVSISATAVYLRASVLLPHGATVTAAKVFGSAAGETWTLRREDLTGSTIAMATTGISGEDTTIVSPVIDNSSYQYYFETSSLDSGDTVISARVTYTT